MCYQSPSRQCSISIALQRVRKDLTVCQMHCAKNVQIRSFFWSIFSCIRTEYRKIRTRKNSIFGLFSRSDTLSRNFSCSKSELCAATQISFFVQFSDFISDIVFTICHIQHNRSLARIKIIFINKQKAHSLLQRHDAHFLFIQIYLYVRMCGSLTSTVKTVLMFLN